MASWFIFDVGGSGVDTKTLELALVGHRPVIVVVRNPQIAAGLQERGVQVFIDDACDSQVTVCACRATGQHAMVTSSVGGAQDYLVHRTVIDETEKAEIKRMILVTSLGRSNNWPFLSLRARAAFSRAVREKSLAESWLQTSLLDYAILRPDSLLNSEATGLAQRIQAEECHGFVVRADVAWHIHELTTTPALNDQIYSLVEPGLKPT